MRLGRLHRVAHEETGSSLLVTLVLITVMTVLVGAVVALYLAQYRFFRRDAHRLQARYAAEAAVYVAMDSLQQNPWWRPSGLVALPEGQTGRVAVEAFGGYRYIRATATYRRSRSTVRALVGEVMPADFRAAVYLWDTESSMHVAGTTRLTGDVIVGPRGLRESTYKRRRFTGRVDGSVRRVPDLKAPFFDGAFLAQAVVDLERYLNDASGTPPPEKGRALAQRLPSENRVYVASGSLRLTTADSLLLRDPVTVVARGNLTLEGPLRFQPGSVFIAGTVMTMDGVVAGREGLFFGRERVEIEGPVRCAGQFLSRKHIRVSRDAYLRYPSVLYIAGDAIEADGAIVVEDGAVVNGTLVHPPVDPEPSVARGRIVVEPAAQVRGALFNAHETEFHGVLYGSLLTRQLFFYESPTSYVNWLKDAVIDVDERPIKYILPFGFSLKPRVAVLHWEAHVEEPGRGRTGAAEKKSPGSSVLRLPGSLFP